MYEVEVKLRTPHEAVRGRLADATHEFDVRQVDTYYDHPSRDFAETDEALRVRRETVDGEATAKVTYKGPLVDAASKTREEHETAVAEGDELHAVLEGVGFRPAATVEKDREVWTLDGYTVALDTVEGLGEFVEVELESDDVETAREGAFDVVRRLGLDPDDQVRESYLAMLLADEGHAESPPSDANDARQ